MSEKSTSMRLPAALAPMADGVFRNLWLAGWAANMTMWMNDVAAAWLMTSLTTSTVMVALVSTASTLPMFLLGLPSGAMADIVDRRRYFASTQLWVSLNAVLLVGFALADALTAELLLLLTFTNGIGMALRLPVFAAVLPQVVPRDHLPQALALNGIAMNLSRVLGPMLAGALLASLGPASVFGLNVAFAALSFALIMRWRSTPHASTLPGERFVGAMRAGIAFAMATPRLKVVYLRIFLFFFQSTAITALLPLVAKRLHDGGPGSFTLMLSSAGVGAIIAALLFPRWRARYNRDQFVWIGTLVHAAVSALIVAVPEPWLAIPGMMVVGMSWISVANSLSIAAQVVMPDWVRARGMSLYQMSLMGGAAAGSMIWGQVASRAGVAGAVWAASVFGCLVVLLTRRLTVEGGTTPDFTRAPPLNFTAPAFAIGPDEGPVMVTVEYQIDPERAAEFSRVMQLTRGARLRQGALSWGLFRDVTAVDRYIEYFVDESWLEHQRRLERFTAYDADLRERRLAFHVGPTPPRVRRYVGGDVAQAPPQMTQAGPLD